MIFIQVTSPPSSPTSLPADLQQDSPAAGGFETITTYDQQGFPVVVTQPSGATTAAKHYDDQGFLITTAATLASRASPTSAGEGVANSAATAQAATVTSAPPQISKISAGVQRPIGLEIFWMFLSAVSCTVGAMTLL